MGIELVKAVSALGAHLPARPFKVLLRMALVALDRPSDGRPARLYFGGWEVLAFAMGYDVPAENKADAAVTARRAKLQEYVRLAVQQIDKAGLIDRLVEHPRDGDRQVYRLCLDPASAPSIQGGSSPLERGGLSPLRKGVLQPPQIEGLSPLEKGGPRKDIGGTEDLPQDSTTHSSLSPEGGAREADAARQTVREQLRRGA